MSVEQVIALLSSARDGEPSRARLERQCSAVQLAMQVLPGFGEAVAAQMRWTAGERPVNSTNQVEALRQYLDHVPGLEEAYRAVVVQEPELLEGSPYFGSP